MSVPDRSHTGAVGARAPHAARRLGWTLVISACLHLVLTPLAGLVGAFALLMRPPLDDGPEAEVLRSIPITFLGEWQPEPAGEPSPVESTAPAGAPPAPQAKTPPLERSEGPKPAEAKAPPPAAPRQAPGEIGHPVALSGVKSEVVDSNANVNLLLLTERIREHPLGPRIGRLLVEFPQWSSFFASGAVDPVQDIDRILIVGPQLRRSADVVAILQHHVPKPVLRAAIDALVQRPPRGRWLPGKVTAARAHADRAERVFALTAPRLLVVAPPELERQVLTAPPTALSVPEGDQALVLHIKTPWRALMGLPLRLPESIAWLRLDLTPLEGGSVRVRVTGEDADGASAARNAQSLSTAVNALTNPDLGPLGALMGLRSIAFVDRIALRAEGRRISGQVDITPRQLERLLVYAEELVRSWTGRRARAVEPKPAQP